MGRRDTITLSVIKWFGGIQKEGHKYDTLPESSLTKNAGKLLKEGGQGQENETGIQKIGTGRTEQCSQEERYHADLVQGSAHLHKEHVLPDDLSLGRLSREGDRDDGRRFSYEERL